MSDLVERLRRNLHHTAADEIERLYRELAQADAVVVAMLDGIKPRRFAEHTRWREESAARHAARSGKPAAVTLGIKEGK